MINITNSILALAISYGGCMMLNKSNPFGNFVYLLTLLTLWVLANTVWVNKCFIGTIISLNVILSTCVCLSVKTKSLLIFYILFELSIIPITLIVFLYGYQPEKLQASLALLLYTVVRRLPLLLFIIFKELTIFKSAIMTIPVTLSFMVKTPMYLLHTWLPKAHVEAPVGGSMVLAGVLLKLGSYGLLIFLPYIKLNNIVIVYLRTSLLGSLLRAIMCLRQGDIKLIIAYSSVVHISVVSLGFIRGSEIGYVCGLIMVLSHGLCSPFMFALAFWLYENSHSRLLMNNNRPWPVIILRLGCLITLNIRVPPRLSVWAEVFMTIRTLNLIRSALPLIISLFFLNALYNLSLYTGCAHRKFRIANKTVESANLFPLIQVIFLGYSSICCLDFFHLYFNFIILTPSSVNTYK